MAYDHELANRIRGCLGPRADLVEKNMFGGLAFLISGKMTIAASGQGGALVRIDPKITSEVIAASNAKIMVMRGKEMPGWLRIGSENLSDEELLRWVELSISYIKTLSKKKM